MGAPGPLAQGVRPSAYFARKVLKAIREEEKRPRFTITTASLVSFPAAASAALSLDGPSIGTKSRIHLTPF